MSKKLLLAAGCIIFLSCNSPTTESAKSTNSDSATTMEKKTPGPVEFADMKYMELGKKNLEMLAHGDIDGWMAAFNDSARWIWSNGDSLVGKAAITNYWKQRRGKIIDSLSFTNDIWLPIKINQPQKGPDRTGIWLLSWSQVHVKYKNGKILNFWVHMDHHFDNNDKIDQTVEYIDNAPIIKAIGK